MSDTTRVRISVRRAPFDEGTLVSAIEFDAGAMRDPHLWPKIVGDVASAVGEVVRSEYAGGEASVLYHSRRVEEVGSSAELAAAHELLDSLNAGSSEDPARGRIEALLTQTIGADHARHVVQPWVALLTFMQQSVLLTALRGPDGIRKDHVSKRLCRWLRRCVLYSAFDKRALANPWEQTGGSFTGPSCDEGAGDDWPEAMYFVLRDYLRTVDELPHHFQLHLMHAAEILGYKHPEPVIRHWWRGCYVALANDMHLPTESEEDMDRRLGDSEPDWRAAEEVTAR